MAFIIKFITTGADAPSENCVTSDLI